MEFRYDCGVPQPSSVLKISDQDMIISSIAKHFAVHRCKTELDQLLKGLENLGVLELVRANTKMMREIFLGTVIMKNVTADLLFDLFPAHFSATGSNRREQEERIVMFWDNYNQKVEGKSNVILSFIIFRCNISLQHYFSAGQPAHSPILSGSPEGFEVRDPRDKTMATFKIAPHDILSFATGAASVPPLGFIPTPSLQFDDTSFFPRANTCANTLYLPLRSMNIDEFIFYMSFGVCNAAGFGRV